MRFLLLFVSFLLIFILGIGIGKTYFQNTSFVNPLGKVIEKVQHPLEKYTFAHLRKTSFPPSVISLGDVVKEETDFSSIKFYFLVDGKKVSGLMNIPTTAGIYPVLVLFRGFVPKETYTSGEGSRRTAEYFAKQGFITLAPDFLGFGDSEKGSENGMEDRFQTYTTGLTLLSSIKNLNKTLEATESGSIQADTTKVGIWGHSNGGHIALSVLAISGKPYPTVLWNPVSKPFPYSILYFTDEYDDHGKALRKFVADFEEDYDVEKYSPPNYYKYITAPIQLDQAVDDEEVPLRWSNELNTTLKELDVDVTYNTYPGENHNFTNGSWQKVVTNSSGFFKEALRI